MYVVTLLVMMATVAVSMIIVSPVPETLTPTQYRAMGALACAGVMGVIYLVTDRSRRVAQRAHRQCSDELRDTQRDLSHAYMQIGAMNRHNDVLMDVFTTLADASDAAQARTELHAHIARGTGVGRCVVVHLPPESTVSHGVVIGTVPIARGGAVACIAPREIPQRYAHAEWFVQAALQVFALLYTDDIPTYTEKEVTQYL